MLWGNINFNDICIIKLPEVKKKKQQQQGIKNLFKKIMSTFF